MTINDKNFLNECKQCLDFFNINYKSNIIYLSDSGNSVIMKNKGPFSKRMIGLTLNEIVQYVAKADNKKTDWEDYR